MPKYRYNRYRDLEIDVSRLQFADDRESFLHVIRQEFDKWAGRLNHSRERFTAVMWYNVPKEVSRVVPWLIDSDPAIRMHHANANRIMFVRPHPSSHGSAQIPSYGTHYVKVECVVLEEGTGRVLMVKERIGADAPFKNVSGSSESGEFFADAAMREVGEETGVRTRFVCLFGCGNRLRTRFDRDEIIMGCLLIAEQGQMPRADGTEVSLADWFDPSIAISTCTPMAREWLMSANACDMGHNRRSHTRDIFRGDPHSMDFFVPHAVQQHLLR